MKLPFVKNKKTDPVLEKIVVQLEDNLGRCYMDDARRKYRRLVSCFEEALAKGKLSEEQQSYYYDLIHYYRGRLGIQKEN